MSHSLTRNTRSVAVAVAVALGGCTSSASSTSKPRAEPTTTAKVVGSAVADDAVVTPPPQRSPSPIGDAAASLPLAISGLTSLELDWYAHFPTADDPVGALFGKEYYTFIGDKKETACMKPVIEKIKAVYEATFIFPLEIKVARLAYGGNVNEIVKCLAKLGEKRTKKSKDPRIAQLSLLVLTQLPGDWIMWTEDTKGLDEVLASISDTPNPLGAITMTQPTSAYSSAVAIDYAWEVFGVPSLGTVFEYEKPYEDGALVVRVAFADADAAKLARQRLDRLPDDRAEQTLFGQQVPALLARLRTMKVTVEGNEVVLRGNVKWNEKDESLFGIFLGAPPVRRPLTQDERDRLLRRPAPGDKPN